MHLIWYWHIVNKWYGWIIYDLIYIAYFSEGNIQLVCVHWPISNKIGTNSTVLTHIELNKKIK